MKRKILAMGGVLAIVAAGGAAWLMLAGSGEPKTLAAYWDGAAEINAADKSGRLPLVMAVEAGDEAAAKYLIEQGADTDRADRNGVSALAAAAARGDFSLFEAVAAASKADLKTPQLMDKALDGGNVKIVKLLLEKGSDANAVLVFKGKHKPEEMPDYKDPRVITPLKKAVAAGRADIAAVLLDKGADGAAYFLAENVRTATPELVRALGDKAGDLREIETGNTDLLTYAAEMAPADTLAYLIEKNAGDVNAALQRVLTHRKDAESTGAKAENGAAGAMSGMGGAERIAGTENGANAAEKNPSETAQIIELFLQNGARPTVAAMELMLAERRTDAYLALAQCSPNPNALTAKNESMLMYAAEKGSPETAARLIDDGISFAAADNEGRTALMYAAGSGNVPLAEMLLEKGDDVDKTDVKGRTALAYAAKNGNAEIIRLIRDYGADIYLADKDGKQPVVYAIEQGNAEAFDLLTDGFMLFGSAVGRNGKTVLMYAVGNHEARVDAKAIEELLAAVKRIDQNDDNGRTALMYAAANPTADTGILEQLIEKGATVQAADNTGKTALMYAAEGGDIGKVRLLLAAGANASVQTQDGKTAADFAKGNGKCFADAVRKLLK